MALFVGVGAMSLIWAIGIAVVVLIEKVRPEGVVFGRIAGALLIVAGDHRVRTPGARDVRWRIDVTEDANG